MAKRPYSKEFTPRTTRRVSIDLGDVPPGLKAKIQTKARAEHIAVRTAGLRFLKAWAEGRIEIPA